MKLGQVFVFFALLAATSAVSAVQPMEIGCTQATEVIPVAITYNADTQEANVASGGPFVYRHDINGVVGGAVCLHGHGETCSTAPIPATGIAWDPVRRLLYAADRYNVYASDPISGEAVAGAPFSVGDGSPIRIEYDEWADVIWVADGGPASIGIHPITGVVVYAPAVGSTAYPVVGVSADEWCLMSMVQLAYNIWAVVQTGKDDGAWRWMSDPIDTPPLDMGFAGTNYEGWCPGPHVWYAESACGQTWGIAYPEGGCLGNTCDTGNPPADPTLLLLKGVGTAQLGWNAQLDWAYRIWEVNNKTDLPLAREPGSPPRVTVACETGAPGCDVPLGGGTSGGITYYNLRSLCGGREPKE